MIPWLGENDAFPSVDAALAEPNGLLAAGGDLSPERLVAAYRRGIFPWFSSGEPIMWWSPDPRMVLFPDEFHASHSLRRRLRQGAYEVRLDSAFPAVVRACAETARAGQRGTWISGRMQRAYARLFELGLAHSVETWVAGRLVGGLYGVALGPVFYGESMFAHVPDASKIALAHLSRFLVGREYRVIDCQMNTAHLSSLGAREISRRQFAAMLDHIGDELAGECWAPDAARVDWTA